MTLFSCVDGRGFAGEGSIMLLSGPERRRYGGGPESCANTVFFWLHPTRVAIDRIGQPTPNNPSFEHTIQRHSEVLSPLLLALFEGLEERACIS